MAEPMSDYSLAALHPAGIKQDLLFFGLNRVLPGALGLLTRFRPVLNVPGSNYTIVTGFDEVQEVFSRQRDFEVPYEAQMEVLEWKNFVLAMQDTDQYHHILGNMMALWRPDDMERIAEIVRHTAGDILQASAGTIDLISDLVTPTLLAIVEQYYGVGVSSENQQSFFDGNLAGSGFVFSGPKISDKKAAGARAAAAAVWPVIDAAMDKARTAAAAGEPVGDHETVLDRYYRSDPTGADTQEFLEDEMRSSMMAMIGGFLPTDTNATGRIMVTLMENPDARRFVQQAHQGDDDEALLRGLHETLRLNYIIPLLWRRANGDQQLGVASAPDDRTTIADGRILAISLQSAMADRRRVPEPDVFNADRSRDDYLIYGHRFHYCVGARISDTILLELFKLLLSVNARKPEDASRQEIRWVGMYPWNVWIDHDQLGELPE